MTEVYIDNMSCLRTQHIDCSTICRQLRRTRCFVSFVSNHLHEVARQAHTCSTLTALWETAPVFWQMELHPHSLLLQKNASIFKCYSLQKAHSTEQTPSMKVLPSGTHFTAESTEASVSLKDIAYLCTKGLNR